MERWRISRATILVSFLLLLWCCDVARCPRPRRPHQLSRVLLRLLRMPLHGSRERTTDNFSFFRGVLRNRRKVGNVFKERKKKIKPLDMTRAPTPVLVRAHGYPVETHKVRTSDGYVLTLHRIPYSIRSHNKTEPRRPVLLQHGILCSSADWVMGAPEKSLGYILADAGYDVWLGNFRGNAYSRAHVSLDPARPPFWSFGLDEMGRVDLPAMISHILERTGRSDLLYVGHSMGTTALWIMADVFPEWTKQRVSLAVGMAPVARLDHMVSPIKYLINFKSQIEYGLLQLGQYAFWTQDSIQSKLTKMICDEPPPSARETLPERDRLPEICDIPQNIIFIIAGYDKPQMNMAFDSGSRAANLAIHGSPHPRRYRLSRSDFPVALFWGENDWVAAPEDVQWLARELPNVILNRRVPLRTFNHLDFLWAKDADKLVYRDVVRLFDHLAPDHFEINREISRYAPRQDVREQLGDHLPAKDEA